MLLLCIFHLMLRFASFLANIHVFQYLSSEVHRERNINFLADETVRCDKFIIEDIIGRK